MNIAQLLVRAARVFPDRVAVTRGAAPHASYRVLAQRAAAMAHHFRTTMRLDSGDRVALCMPNCPEYLEVLAGIWWAGATAVPINARLPQHELAAILDDAGASCCFVGPGTAAASVAVIGEHRSIDVSSVRYRKIVDSAAAAPITWCVPDDVAWLFYTSDRTTGRPKGAMLSHRNLLAMTLGYFADVDAIGANDCIIHAAPLSHGSGLHGLPHLAAAATQVVPESGGFDPAEIFALTRQWHGATLFAAPAMVKRLVEHVRSAHPVLDGIKTIVYGGEPMAQADIVDALAVMGQRFVQVYGRGESPMTITALAKFHFADSTHPRYLTRLASVGVAQSAVEVRVVDALDHVLPPGTPGEIIVRGDVVMRGYWMNPTASAATLKGGWLHTGDTGAFDDDGFLTLMARAKDVAGLS